MTCKRLLGPRGGDPKPAGEIRCKTRRNCRRRGLWVAVLALSGAGSLAAQQSEADEAWSKGRYEAARRGYERVLKQDPNAALASLRLGILLSWDNKLDSSLVLISRARAADPQDAEMALTHARVRAWNKQYGSALALYDTVLARRPHLRDAELGRAQTLAWAGMLETADSAYSELIEKDSLDRDARLGHAQVSAWRGKLPAAARGYRAVLKQHPRDVDALVGLGHVYYWQGRVREARQQARAALAVDSTHRAGRQLKHTTEEALRPALEASANWSNDSDRNTSFLQSLSSAAVVGRGVSLFGSVNALETSDPVRHGTRFGGEAGLGLALGKINLSGAAGARRISANLAPSRTSATYRARVVYRPVAAVGFNLGYSRSPFDEIAALMERALDLELLEAGFDARPFRGFSFHAAGSELWLSDGNNRSGVVAGFSQKLHRRFTVGVFGRTLSFERRGVGYFSPDRFSVLEGTAAYAVDTPDWSGSLGGGLGAQQVGKGGEAQAEWHLDGRLSRRWGVGNRIELFGLLTNSAVSSTSGAFRYRSAGLSVRLGL